MASKLERVFRGMVYILPGVLFFSYWPLMHFGASESMNFEISLPLIWLVVFDLLVVVMLGRRKKFWKGIGRGWMWLLFPLWLTVSVLWSMNTLRGVLTVGILWLIYLAVYGFVSLKSVFHEVGFREKFWKVFFGTALVACVWCWAQCVLDLVGVPREFSLMCAGCTYAMFGFPHPCGWAIEPQFMGNLLLAPVLIAGYFALKNKRYWWVFLVLAATLFLTFSRGAIYAFVVGMVVMTVWELVRRKSWRILGMWVVVGLAFLFTLDAQGIMAAVSPTNDTYTTGVAKVLNHLTLGVVDVREEVEPVSGEVVEANEVGEVTEVTEAVFDGYVAESTDTRLRLSGAAMEVWSGDLVTAVFGVGLGGAGQAMYVNGLSPAPKEIVQNQYVSLLLETGVVGVALALMTLILIVRVVWKSEMRVMVLSLLVAYGVTLLFFAGLPNALQIYLLPGLVMVVGFENKTKV